MSKFIEKLSSSNKAALPAMGFRQAGVQEKPASVITAVELSGRSEDEVRELAEAGVDAGILEAAGLSASALGKHLKVRGSMAIGLVLSAAKLASEMKLVSEEIDFVIFDPGLPVKAFESREFEATGKVLRISSDLEVGLLRSVNELHPAVGAVSVDLRASPLTVESLMGCRKSADFSGQPVVALVNKALSRTELLALRECGVKCVVLPADAAVDDVKKIIDDIKSLPRVEKKKDRRGLVLLPRIEAAPAAREDEGDGDE